MAEYLVTVRRSVVQLAVLRVRARTLEAATDRAMRVVVDSDFASAVTTVEPAGTRSYNETYDAEIEPSTPHEHIRSRMLHHPDRTTRSLALRLWHGIREPSFRWFGRNWGVIKRMNNLVTWTDVRARKPRTIDQLR
jgi:hypothetical protein